MIGPSLRLAGLAILVPEARRSLADCVAAAGGTAMEAKAFGRLFGIDQVAVLPPDYDPRALYADLLTEALATRAPDAPLPKAVIHVHGNPVQPFAGGHLTEALCDGVPGLAEVQYHFEMDQQNCSTLFWAIQAARQLIASGQCDSVAIVAGDSMAHLPAGERYAPGCTAIGDAAAVLVVDGRSGGWQLSEPWLATLPEHASGRFGPAAEVQAFNSGHSDFVTQILAALGSDAPDCTRPILGHNINRLSWSKFARDTGTDLNRIHLRLLPDVGHCYTLDALLMVPDLIEAGNETADLLSVGQGGFLAGLRLWHQRGPAHVYS